MEQFLEIADIEDYLQHIKVYVYWDLFLSVYLEELSHDSHF